MRTIHKYALQPIVNQVVSTHLGARVLHVAQQHGQITLWAEVDTANPPSTLDVHVVPTGGEVPLGDFAGTVLVDDGLYVFHVYVGRNR